MPRRVTQSQAEAGSRDGHGSALTLSGAQTQHSLLRLPPRPRQLPAAETHRPKRRPEKGEGIIFMIQQGSEVWAQDREEKTLFYRTSDRGGTFAGGTEAERPKHVILQSHLEDIRDIPSSPRGQARLGPSPGHPGGVLGLQHPPGLSCAGALSLLLACRRRGRGLLPITRPQALALLGRPAQS